MKYFLLTFFIALAATVPSNAQTLQVDPIYIGGTAAFEVQGGTPGGVAIVCYSINGTGPFTLANGLSLDLSMPIRQLNPMVLNGIGDGYLGPFPTPSSAIVGMQVWFQAVDVNIWSSQILSATNMVPITLQQYPPIAVDDYSVVHKDDIALIDVLSNDSDPEGGLISLVSVDAQTNANGSAIIIGGQIEYTPQVGYAGADSFTYVIEDEFSAQATATVFVDVYSGGSLVSWGFDGDLQVSNTPLDNTFVQVSAGWAHSVALKSDGSLVSWGADSYSQVLNTPTTNDFTQVAAGGNHSVALKSDGTLVSWGRDVFSVVSDTPTTNDFTQVSAGYENSAALKSDGSLESWGADVDPWGAASGQVANTPQGNDFTHVSVGGTHSVALRLDGSLVSWGSNADDQVADTPQGNDFVEVSAGFRHSIALRSDGTLASWGWNGHGEISDTPTTNGFISVAASDSFSAVLQSDGTLKTWGWDAYQQESDTPQGNNFFQVSVGGQHCVAIEL